MYKNDVFLVQTDKEHMFDERLYALYDKYKDFCMMVQLQYEAINTVNPVLSSHPKKTKKLGFQD